MSTKVLDYWRQEEPRFRDVSDDVLTSFIAADSPQFLQDPTFAKRVALMKERAGTTSPVADAVGSALSAVPDWANASGEQWGQAASDALGSVGRAVMTSPAEYLGLRPGGQLLSDAARLAGEDANKLTDYVGLDRQGLPARAIEQGARTLPLVAAAAVGARGGLPTPVSMGIPMGEQTYAETGDLGAAARATSIGMLLGPAQEFGAAFGSQFAGRVASLTASETAQNAAIALGRVTGSQSMVNGLMVAEQAPDLIELARTDPAKARDELILLVAGNLAFDVPHLLPVAREALARSQVESYLKSGDYKAAVDAAARSGGRVRQGEAPVHQGPLGEVPLPEARPDPSYPKIIGDVRLAPPEATGKPALQVAPDPISPAPVEGRSQNVAPTTTELRPVAGGSSSPDIIAQLTGRPSVPVDVPPPVAETAPPPINRDVYVPPNGSYGDMFNTPDGNIGFLRGGGGAGSDRVRVEYVDGGSGWYNRAELKLRARINPERLPTPEADAIMAQVKKELAAENAERNARLANLSKEVSADPMPKVKPAVDVPAAKFDQEMFQGRGASPEAVYGPEAVAEGRAVPILGPGSYYAFSGGDAKTYGTVTKAAVRLKNPLVIDSSRKWADLMAAADAKHLDSGDRWFYAEPQGIAPATLRLKAYVQAQGHDGIIIRGTQLDQNKRLRESFGHDQVVSYEAKPATPKPAAPEPAALTKDRADVAAAEAQLKELNVEYLAIHKQKLALEGLVLKKGGQLKSGAKKQDVEVWNGHNRRLQEIDRASDVVRHRVAQQRMRIRAAELDAVAGDAEAPDWQRVGAKVGALTQRGQEVPDALLKAMQTANGDELRRMFPDIRDVEVGRLESMLGSFAMEYRPGDVPPGPAIAERLQEGRRQALANAVHQAQTGMIAGSLPPDVLAQLTERLGDLRYQRRERPGKGTVPVSAEDLVSIPAKVREAAIANHAREHAEGEAKAEASRQLTAHEGIELATAQKMMADASAEMAKSGKKRRAKDIKEELLARVTAAHQEAPVEWGADGAKKFVVIAVPGDGIFRVENTKEKLGGLLKRVKSLETATGSAASPGTPKGTPVPKLGVGLSAPEALKVLKEFQAEDPDRLALNFVFSDGRRALASNGRVMVEVRGEFKPSDKAATPFPKDLLDRYFRKGKEHEGAAAMVPTEDLFRIARMAKRMDFKEEPFVDLYADATGRKVYGEVTDQRTDGGADFAAYGLPQTAIYLGRANAAHLGELVELARKMGDEKVRLGRADWTVQETVKDKAGKPSQQDVPARVLTMEGEGWRGLMARFNKEARPDVRELPADKVGESNPKAAGGDDVSESRSASGAASVGGFVEATSKAAGQSFTDSPGLGARDVLPANNMPELVRMVTDLLGAAPELKKSLGMALAYFRHNGVSGVIRMRYDQFLHENARELPQLLAHEIGHAVDWLPDRSMKRGNLIGRVRSLRDFLKGSFGELKDKELRQELLGVSQWWRQWDPAKLDDTSRKYFTSGKELYADAVSVLFNSPGDLQARAPKFYEALMRYMDAKPPVKEAFIELQTLLARGPEAVAAERLTRKREGYVKGDEELARILREKEAARTSIKGFMLDVQQTHIDRATLVNQAVKKFHKEGRADAEAAATSAREAWEESLFADNRTALDLAAIFEHSLHPLKDLGLDQHDLGAVIELQRVIGNKDAREQLVAKLGTLGRDQYRRAVALAAEWDRMLAGAGNDPAKLDLIEGGMRAKAEEAGLEFDDITEVSKLKAEQGTRAEIANPGGFLPADAEMTLKELLAAKTPGQRGALLSASSEFRKVFNRRVLEAVDAGIYSESFRKLHEANKDTYAAFRSLDHVDDFVSPAIRRAKGTLKDIENPFYTTILKLRSLNNLIARNAALVQWRNLFMREFPESWQKAGRYHDGVRFHDKAPAKGMERLIVREGGKPVAYDVDPHVADAFRDPDRLKGMWRVVDYGFRTGVYPLIIKYNPYFQYISNPLRDASRSARNLGAMAGWKAELKFRTSVAKRWVAPFAEPFAARSERLRGFLEDWESARNFVKGAPDAIGREMMEVAAIGTPHDSITQLDVRDGFAELMRRYHLAKPEHQGLLRRALTAIPRHIQYAGAIREALPKVAAYRILTRDLGWSPRQAATVVRNYVGTPNHKVKGTLGTLDSTMVPFLNIFLQGYRADTRFAMSPKTAGGWWARWAMGDGARAVLQGLAVSGVFGAAAQQLYQGIPENDKSNYNVIPIGSEMGGDFGSRTVYVRIPRDEASRLLAALTYKLTRVMAGDAAGGMAAQDAFRVGEGSVPGVSPLFQVAGAWKDYLGGQNPVDPFRNRPVIPATEFAAGGTAALKPMLTWTLDKTGLLSFVAFNRDAKTTTEMYTDAGTSVRDLARGEGGVGDAIKVAEALPAITKLIKTSDYGYVERQREEERAGAQGKASVRVDYVPEVRGMINEYQNLSRTPHRTEEQETRFGALKAWHREFLKYDEALQKMQQEPSARADVPRIQKEFNNFSRQFVEDVLKRKRGEFKAFGTAEGNR